MIFTRLWHFVLVAILSGHPSVVASVKDGHEPEEVRDTECSCFSKGRAWAGGGSRHPSVVASVKDGHEPEEVRDTTA